RYMPASALPQRPQYPLPSARRLFAEVAKAASLPSRPAVAAPIPFRKVLGEPTYQLHAYMRYSLRFPKLKSKPAYLYVPREFWGAGPQLRRLISGIPDCAGVDFFPGNLLVAVWFKSSEGRASALQKGGLAPCPASDL